MPNQRLPIPHPSGVALVTGAANRIGATIARRLAAAGLKVIIHYRSSGDTAKALAREIGVAGGEVTTIRADLGKRRERATLIARAAGKFGALTVLVNNASIFEPDSVADIDEALWDAHFAIHVEAPVFLARDFAAQLPDTVQGNIVNIIDERVLHLTPNYFSYTLSKAALWTATRTMAQSLAPRVRVNAIGPGPTLPEAGQSDASFKKTLAPLLLGTGATPEDVADGVLYILGAKSMTGQMLSLDGGRHLSFPTSRGPTPSKKTRP